MYPVVKEELIKPYWSKDFLRHDPHKDCVEYDYIYLLNQAEAHNYFYNWFRKTDNVSFVDMLKNQHRFACLSEKLNRPYRIKGYFRSKEHGSNNWDERDSFPGKLRHELKMDRVSHPAIDLLRLNKDEFKYIKNEKFFNDLYCVDKNNLDFKKTNINYGPYYIQCKIEALGKHWVHNFKYYKNGYFKINHPIKEEYMVCMKHVSKIMSKLISINQTNDKTLLIELLGEYYHNAINWMPFPHVNNSLFMGQINALLRHNKLSSVPHSKLDVYALLTSTRNFVPIFKEYVISFQ